MRTAKFSKFICYALVIAMLINFVIAPTVMAYNENIEQEEQIFYESMLAVSEEDVGITDGPIHDEKVVGHEAINNEPPVCEPVEGQNIKEFMDDGLTGYEAIDAEQYVERTEKRTEYAKYYELGSKKLEAVVFGLPVHYLQDGEYKDIDNSLELLKIEDGRQNMQMKRTAFILKYLPCWTITG